MPIIGPHLVGCRTHLLKRTVCLACLTVLAAGELVTWAYVEENEQTMPGTSMFACLSHDSEELEFFAFPEIKRRATEARREAGSGIVAVTMVRQEDATSQWWQMVQTSGDPHARRIYEEAARGKVFGRTPK